MLPILLQPEDLLPHLHDDNLVIIDLCREEIYQQFHLPGAIHVSPAELVAGTKPATGKLPSLERLQQLFSRIGYSPDKHYVVYDDEGGGWAGRFIWTLDVIGHTSSSYLDGGLVAWAADKHPMTNELPEVTPTEVSIQLHHDLVASKQEILDKLDHPDFVVWDARSPEEYAGTRVVAARGGHIPGAINLDWVELMDRQRDLRLRKDVEASTAARGFDKSKTNETNCQTHHRSGLTYLVGKILGLNIKANDGSWSEGGNDPDTPVE